MSTAATNPSSPSRSSESSDTPGSGQATVAVTVRLTRANATGLDQAPVVVDFARGRTRNVLAVPVTALVTLATGGYAVNVTGGGTVRQVPVKTGTFATDGSGTGQVQISGAGISQGTRVVIPQ